MVGPFFGRFDSEEPVRPDSAVPIAELGDLVTGEDRWLAWPVTRAASSGFLAPIRRDTIAVTPIPRPIAIA